MKNENTIIKRQSSFKNWTLYILICLEGVGLFLFDYKLGGICLMGIGIFFPILGSIIHQNRGLKCIKYNNDTVEFQYPKKIIVVELKTVEHVKRHTTSAYRSLKKILTDTYTLYYDSKQITFDLQCFSQYYELLDKLYDVAIKYDKQNMNELEKEAKRIQAELVSCKFKLDIGTQIIFDTNENRITITAPGIVIATKKIESLEIEDKIYIAGFHGSLYRFFVSEGIIVRWWVFNQKESEKKMFIPDELIASSKQKNLIRTYIIAMCLNSGVSLKINK